MYHNKRSRLQPVVGYKVVGGNPMVTGFKLNPVAPPLSCYGPDKTVLVCLAKVHLGLCTRRNLILYLAMRKGETAILGIFLDCAINHPSHAKRLNTKASAPSQTSWLRCISFTLSHLSSSGYDKEK